MRLFAELRAHFHLRRFLCGEKIAKDTASRRPTVSRSVGVQRALIRLLLDFKSGRP